MGTEYSHSGIYNGNDGNYDLHTGNLLWEQNIPILEFIMGTNAMMGIKIYILVIYKIKMGTEYSHSGNYNGNKYHDGN